MIAAAVLAVGLAGLSALSLRSVVDTATARDATTAALAAAELDALVRLAPGGLSAWTAPPGQANDDCSGAESCEPIAFATSAYARWSSRLGEELPGAEALVCYDGTPEDGSVGAPACDGNGALWIKIFWAPPGAGETVRLVRRALP